MRILHVLGSEFPLMDEDAIKLLQRDVIYECDDVGHDTHLDPDHEFTVEDVELLLLSLEHASAARQ